MTTSAREAMAQAEEPKTLYTYLIKMGGLIELTIDLENIADEDEVSTIIWDNLLVQYSDPTNMIEQYKLVRTDPLDTP
jgi:hypothetical protein